MSTNKILVPTQKENANVITLGYVLVAKGRGKLAGNDKLYHRGYTGHPIVEGEHHMRTEKITEAQLYREQDDAETAAKNFNKNPHTVGDAAYTWSVEVATLDDL